MRYTGAVDGRGRAEFSSSMVAGPAGAGALQSGAGDPRETDLGGGCRCRPGVAAGSRGGRAVAAMPDQNTTYRQVSPPPPPPSCQEKSPNLGKTPSLRGFCKRLTRYKTPHDRDRNATQSVPDGRAMGERNDRWRHGGIRHGSRRRRMRPAAR